MSKNDGSVWTFCGFALGTGVSVAGNVAHTWHPSDEQLAVAGLTRATAAQWSPELGAQLGAAFFPIALLVTVEVLSRVSWPSGWAWSLARYGGTSLVAAVAAVASYLHLYDLLIAYGEDKLTAIIGPLAVDGLMVVCGFAMLAISRRKQEAAAAADGPVSQTPDTPADIVPDTAGPVPGVAAADIVPVPDMPAIESVSGTPDIAADITPDPAGDVAVDVAPDTASQGDMLPVPTRRKPRRAAAAPDADAVERARELLATDPDMSGAELGRRLELSERQGQRLVAALRAERQEVAA